MWWSSVAASWDPVSLRWLLAMAFPPPSAGVARWLWVLATHGREEDRSVRVSIAPRDAGTESAFTVEPGWNWRLTRLPPAPAASGWHRIQVDPPWNPGLSNFPPDLGLRIHALAVAPCESP
jgi:hypothetical protein